MFSFNLYRTELSDAVAKIIYSEIKTSDKTVKKITLCSCGRQLPWVSRVDHLGIALTEDGELQA